MKLKSPDEDAIPLCRLHHIELGAQNGYFKGWTREQIRLWEREQLRLCHPDHTAGPA